MTGINQAWKGLKGDLDDPHPAQPTERKYLYITTEVFGRNLQRALRERNLPLAYTSTQPTCHFDKLKLKKNKQLTSASRINK